MNASVDVPDSVEVRVARLEAKQESDRRQIETVAPLITQYAVLQTTVEDLRDDIREARQEIASDLKRDRDEMEARLARAVLRRDKQVDDLVRARDKQFEELSRAMQNQVLACSEQVGKLAETTITKSEFQQWLADTQQRKGWVWNAAQALGVATIGGMFLLIAELVRLFGGG